MEAETSKKTTISAYIDKALALRVRKEAKKQKRRLSAEIEVLLERGLDAERAA